MKEDACTFCDIETTEIPRKFTARQAHGAHGLQYLFFCESCEPLLAKFEKQEGTFIKKWIGKNVCGDEFDKAYMRSHPYMEDYACRKCDAIGEEACEWTLLSLDKKNFFFLCETCGKRYRQAFSQFIDNFIEDNRRGTNTDE
jgi:hypothetical protein